MSNRCAVKRAATKTPEAPPANGTSEHQSLSKYIQARFEDCSRSQKDVAQYIVDHLDEAAFQTAEELARRANTSSSTVVRFSQALGFEGFPELQAAAREEYRRVNAKAAKESGAVGPSSSAPLFSLDQNEFESALAADHLNVEETARKVSRSAVESLIAAIVEAEKVLVAGTDQMAFFASYLRHLLMLLDLRVDVVASPSQEALSRLGRIDGTTLVIGLSAGRPHPLVVRAMKLARHRQAKTAAITDATLSEVAKLAQIKLYYSSNSPAYVRSHVALLSIIQALAYGVYAQDSAQYDDRIKAFRLK
jgi:DNA-binding MurR/RpiR family transcriptional regulator